MGPDQLDSTSSIRFRGDIEGLRACPAIVDETPVWRDGDHVTDRMALEVAPLLRVSLDAAGVASAG